MFSVTLQKKPGGKEKFQYCPEGVETHRAMKLEDFEFFLCEHLSRVHLLNQQQAETAQKLKDVALMGQKAESVFQEYINAEEAALDVSELERDQAIYECRNLVRINREKSCKDRKTSGSAKKHSGYIVQQSKERDIMYRHGDESDKARVWETKIQTPYPTDMDAELVKLQVAFEMNDPETELMHALGIDLSWLTDGDGDSDSYFYHRNDDGLAGKNILLDAMYTADTKSGYWAVSYIHTLPLKDIPDTLKP